MAIFFFNLARQIDLQDIEERLLFGFREYNILSSGKKAQAEMRLAKEFLSYIAEKGDEPVSCG